MKNLLNTLMIKSSLNQQKKKSETYTAVWHIKFMKTVLKNIGFILLLFVCIGTLCGCDRQKPGILFSSTPFSKELGYTEQSFYKKGERIYYLLYNPNGFKTRLLKVQVFRKDDGADEFFGYEYLYNKTVELSDRKFYTDFFVINKKGYYIFQTFEYTNTIKPVIIGVVKVTD